MQRCCSVFENALELASLIPINPSEQRMRMSWAEDPLMLPEYRQRTEYHTPEAILKSDFSFPQSLVLVCKLVFFCLP